MLKLDGKKIYLACGKTDMRKSINGLTAIVEGSFKLDLFGNAVFVFCNYQKDRIKILEWDSDGFWLYFKRLEKGRFKWPSSVGSETMILSAEDLYLLLGNPRIIQKLKRQEIKTGAII